MELRLELSELRPPESEYYLWLKFSNAEYRQAHVISRQIDDCPIQLLRVCIFHLFPNGALITNGKKKDLLEDIISDLLISSSIDLLDYFEDLELFLHYKYYLMKKLKDREEVLYYRFIIRTLILEYYDAREVLNLDREDELEALHHLNKAKDMSPQISFELGVFKALEGSYPEAAYHFTELYKSLPGDYQPTANPSKVTTLTIEKLKGYLGVFPEPIEIEEDETYARELFYFAKELDGKRRVNRSVSEQELGNSNNLHIIRSKLENKDFPQIYLHGKMFLKLAITEYRGYGAQARQMFEYILANISEEFYHLWKHALFGCVVLTPLEEPIDDKYFETVLEIINKYDGPNTSNWIYMLGLTLSCSEQSTFTKRIDSLQDKLSEQLVKFADLTEKTKVLCTQSEPFSSDFLTDYYIEVLQKVDSLEFKYMAKFINSIQDPNIMLRLARWLFTAIRVLKFVHKERQGEADSLYLYVDLIHFEPEFMIDVPSDIDYKIKTGNFDFSKIVKLTKQAIDRNMQLNPGIFNDFFIGNVFFLTEKFEPATWYYLKAARIYETPIFLKRLVYSVMKTGALFEGVLLYQLSDRGYSLKKVENILKNVIPSKYLLRFMVDVTMIEYLIDVFSFHEHIKSELYRLLKTPKRHQSAINSKMRKKVLAQLLDLLLFARSN